jgi:hypothetical protein
MHMAFKLYLRLEDLFVVAIRVLFLFVDGLGHEASQFISAGSVDLSGQNQCSIFNVAVVLVMRPGVEQHKLLLSINHQDHHMTVLLDRGNKRVIFTKSSDKASELCTVSF